MKALQIIQPRDIRVIDLPSLAPGEGEVMIKLLYVGFCGSDLNTFRGLNAMAKENVVPGHEIAAEVCELGPGVPSLIQKGQLVTVNPYTNCGHCAACAAGQENACEFNQTLGVQRDGAMQEYICVPWEKLMFVEGIAPRDIALVEPMSVGFHAVERANVSKHDVVMVIGCGMVGLGAVLRSVRRGATVIAADVDEEKLAIAAQLGAQHCYNTSHEFAGLPKPSVIIEAVGAPATYRMALELVDFCGRVACIGYAKSDVPLNTSLIVKKELCVYGSRNATPADFSAVMDAFAECELPLDKLVSAVVTPEQAQKALEDWDAAPGKVFRILVKWNTEN